MPKAVLISYANSKIPNNNNIVMDSGIMITEYTQENDLTGCILSNGFSVMSNSDNIGLFNARNANYHYIAFY